MHYDDCLIMMVKDPEKGKVKSRLAARVGDDLAAALYRAIVTDILNATRKGRYNLRIAFYPPGSVDNIRDWLGDDYTLQAQEGNDLGERMRNAFRKAFREGFTKVALIGSDIPGLTDEVVREAFSSLEGNNAVIGPAFDGGYYLIGFRHEGFLAEAFDGIGWGTGAAYRQTMQVFAAKGQKVHVLPTLRDVDTLEDLRALCRLGSAYGLQDSATAACIMANRRKIL